jgi:N6-adenosine-specific RNA methylase IME4
MTLPKGRAKAPCSGVLGSVKDSNEGPSYPSPSQCTSGLLALEHRGAYGALLVDPPWYWRARSAKGDRRAPPYQRMSFEQIVLLPVGEIAAPDSALFLWCIDSMLREALAVISAWGFRYIKVAFAWAKTGGFGCGYWTRNGVELCLLATRGHPKRLARNVPQLIIAPRREHSRKPAEVRARIERLVAGPYLELFARERFPGWDAWGDELGLFDSPSTKFSSAMPAVSAARADFSAQPTNLKTKKATNHG